MLVMQAAALMTMRVHVLERVPMPGAPIYDRNWVVADPHGEVRHGDVVHLPELMTGAGDFEGLYFAGEPVNGRVQLLGCDVEELSFPAALHALAAGRGSSIRDSYERGVVALCEMEIGLDLEDIYGDADAVAALWDNPPLGAHDNVPPLDHVVQLGACQHRILLQYPIGEQQQQQ